MGEELIKLNKLRKIFEEYRDKKRKTLWGRFNFFMADSNMKTELVCDGIEMFISYDIKEIRKQFLDASLEKNGVKKNG